MLCGARKPDLAGVFLDVSHPMSPMCAQARMGGTVSAARTQGYGCEKAPPQAPAGQEIATFAGVARAWPSLSPARQLACHCLFTTADHCFSTLSDNANSHRQS